MKMPNVFKTRILAVPCVLLILPFLALLSPTCTSSEDLGARIQFANDELFNKGNTASAAVLFSPSYIAHVPSGDEVGGPEMIEHFVNGIRTAFPDLHVDVKILAIQGDRVAWIRKLSGTQKADFMGVAATGRAMVWQEMVVTRFEGGKIVEEWGVSDLGEKLRAQ